VTRSDAKRFLKDFLDHRLDGFGPYEDAIVSGESTLYHSLLSPLINLGLLDPLEVCRAAEERYRKKRARLNSVEGFIRQIVGWREFIYQVYHLKMPDYMESNFFGADLPLPEFYWSGDTGMHCVADAIGTLYGEGINHHIQRLMVTGNFALIAGISPQEVNRWYELAYVDAYQWVVSPNVLGMALYADGGLLATKPYAASANYINKMSDCCNNCAYDRRKTTGEDACPFNSLYWDFLARNRKRFQKNPRMNLVMALLSKKKPTDLRDVRKRAKELRSRIADGEPI
jgi:deoxyribodipyrimidine photolyase-related protein